jgi:hypothetical protein
MPSAPPDGSPPGGAPNILSDLPVWSRNFVIPPSQKGPAGAEQEGGLDVNRVGDDAFLEQVSDLVGDGCERHCPPDDPRRLRTPEPRPRPPK